MPVTMTEQARTSSHAYLVLPPKAVRAAGQLQPTPNIASLKDSLGIFRKKGEKAALFVVVVVVESPSYKYKAGVIQWILLCSFFFSGLKETSNYFFMKKTTASGNLNLQELGRISSL